MKTILIVEDESAILRALQDWVTYAQEKYEVVAARNGEEALQKFTEGHIDLVLLDLVMPTMDGYAFLGALKERDLHPHVVVLSNLGESRDKERALGLGVANYFVKNETKLTTVFEAIKKLLD